jgi:diacylglycerol kinase (ATP)
LILIISEIKRLYRALINSLHGIAFCWKSEAAFRFQAVLFILQIPIVFALDLQSHHGVYLMVIGTIALITEMLNTAIEKTIDRISMDSNELSKHVKDMGSAACFFAQMLWLFSWCYIFYINEAY